MQEIQDHIESLEDKQAFIQTKVINFTKQLITVKPDSMDTMVFNNVQTLEGARSCMTTFF